MTGTTGSGRGGNQRPVGEQRIKRRMEKNSEGRRNRPRGDDRDFTTVRDPEIVNSRRDLLEGIWTLRLVVQIP